MQVTAIPLYSLTPQFIQLKFERALGLSTGLSKFLELFLCAFKLLRDLG